jgi:hypothetical protein
LGKRPAQRFQEFAIESKQDMSGFMEREVNEVHEAPFLHKIRNAGTDIAISPEGEHDPQDQVTPP